MPTRNIKRTYIGGTTSEARKKYFNLDKELTQVVTNLATSYGISPALVIDRLAHEGIIDRLINDHNAHVQRGGEERPSRAFSTNTFNSPYGLFGLDNIFDTYTKGITKTKRPINFIKYTTTNESGERVNTGDTNNIYDTLELFTAELASRREQVKKQYPNLTNDELDSATAARYNATNKYFKQLMDSGEYKTKYPVDVKGVNIPTPTKTDSKYIQDQTHTVNMDRAFRTAPKETFIYNDKSWNPKLFMTDGYIDEPESPIVKHFLNNYAVQNFTQPNKVNFIQEKYKCGGRRKAQLGLDIREGGIAIPIAPNMYYMNGRSHDEGGIGIGPNNKNGLEVEGGEVVKVGKNDVKVFSSVPLLRGVSPAQLVMGGANPNAVFKAQEEFKDRNRINDDGTTYQNGGQKKSNSAIRIETDKKVPAYNRAVYSLVDPTMGYPTKKEAFGYAIGAGIKAMRNPNDMVYWVTDSVSDAAWRKRHGLSYDNKFLIPNEDGSVRLPKDREMEIPTDTTMLKNRIAANEKLAKRYPEGSEKRDIVDWALKVDGMALDSLRHTYRTGEPVTINEGAYNSRRLINNGELSYPGIMPHNVMQNYAIQYDKSKDKMNYWDTYNFNQFEWGVPGKPFEIKGSIPLKKAGGIYIKPSKRGTFTAAATKHGMGVQEFASKVLANKEDYSPAMVEKANFARNANRWKKEYGGDDTKTAALKRLKNKFTIAGKYGDGMFGGAGAGSVIMEQPEYVTDTITKRYLVPVTQNFNDAFRDARNSGKTEFMFDGKLYNTNLGDNPNNNTAGSNRTSTIIVPIEHKEIRRRKKEFGGSMIYTINGNVKNGLMSARPKARYGTINKKDKDTKVGQDGLIYKRAADGEWYTDGTVHVAFKKASPSGLNKPNSSNAKEFKYTAPEPKRVYIDHSDYEEEKETKKIGSLTYEKNESGKWVPASKQSTTTTRDGGRPKDFGMTRTGVNHPNGNYKYHPLTGEKINEIGVVKTSEPSVKGTTKVTSKSSSTPRGRGTKASTPKAAAKSTPTIQDTVNKITMDALTASKTPKIDLSKAKMPSYNVNDLGSKETKAAKAKLNTSSTGGGTQSKDGRWVGQYKTTNAGDWIGLGSNLAGTIASYFITKNAINKMPEPLKPVMTPAVKLKTKYNIQPQLTNISEVEQMNRAAVRRNTQSSNTSLAQEQRLMNEARGARNTLYGQKENIETQLINQDRLNRQSVMRDNVRAYNEYLNRLTATKMAQNEMRVSNVNNLIYGLTGSVNSILGNIESRKTTNNTLRVIAAANPNVDARLIGGFDYYIDPITKKKYNKNQQYVGIING